MLSRRLRASTPHSIVPIPQATYLAWQGHQWWVRSGYGDIGPNHWGRYIENIQILGDGSLQLAIRQFGGIWYAAELDQNDASLGYGSYEFVYTVDAATFDPNVILGLFIYDTTDPAPGKRELDIEVTKWGDASQPSQLWYSLQPVSGGEWRQYDHLLSPAAPYTSRFIWQPGQAYFRTTDANGVLLGETLVTDGVETPGNEKVGINLWLLGGQPPKNGNGATARIYSFTHTPGATYTPSPAASYRNDFSTGYGITLKAGALIAGGSLSLSCVAGYSIAYTGNTIPIANSSMYIKTVSLPLAGNGTTEAIFSLRIDANNYVSIFVSGGGMVARVCQNGTKTNSSVGTYDPAVHRYWQISHSAAQFRFATSADGTTWTTVSTLACPFGASALATMKLRLECGYYGSETSPAPFVIAGINTN